MQFGRDDSVLINKCETPEREFNKNEVLWQNLTFWESKGHFDGASNIKDLIKIGDKI